MTRDVVVIGGSAGGVTALRTLLPRLHSNYAGSVFVVIHRSSIEPSMLPAVLARHCNLPVEEARDGSPIRPGRVLVAAPDQHLLLDAGRVLLHRGPRENRQRPAIDPLFRSAARHYGSRVLAVLLSGLLDDGVAGLMLVAARGGLTAVQDPEDALFSQLPNEALRYFEVGHRLPAQELGDLLQRTGPTQPRPTANAAVLEEPPPGDSQKAERWRPESAPTPFTCPTCQGNLWDVSEGDLPRYRCRTGHVFTEMTLALEQDMALESSLWAALKGLEEAADLALRMATRASAQGQSGAAETYQQRHLDLNQHAENLRGLLQEL